MREAGKIGPAILQSVEPLLPVGLNIHVQSTRCFTASFGKFSGDSIFRHSCSFLKISESKTFVYQFSVAGRSRFANKSISSIAFLTDSGAGGCDISIAASPIFAFPIFFAINCFCELNV